MTINDVLPLPAAYGQSPVAFLYPNSSYNDGAFVGLDRIGFLNASGSGSPLNIGRALVYKMADPSFWVSTLGIGLTDFKAQDNTLFESILGNLSDLALLPSTSWGYTAGAHYCQYLCRSLFAEFSLPGCSELYGQLSVGRI